MKLLYFYRVPLPDARADAIQIVNTCAAVVRAGGDVDLHVESLRPVPTSECLRFYGIEHPVGAGAGRLALVAMGVHWSWPLFDSKVRRILKRAGPSRACLFVREVRRYVPRLIARAKAAGLPVIFEAHNVSAQLVQEKRERGPGGGRKGELTERAALESSVVKAADGLICTQGATLEELKHLLKPGLPTMILGNATQIPPRPGRAESKLRDIDVLYCGSLKAWKGVDGLVAAVRGLDPYRLTIVGPASPPDARRVRDAAQAAGVAGRVTILPAVSPVEVWGLYERARVGVIPLAGKDYVEARNFTSPLKLFEMMAAGLPIVASRVGSITEYVEDRREALLVPAGDPVALADSIRQVLTDESLAQSLAAAARQRVAGNTWDNRGRSLLAFAEQVAG